MYHILVYLSNWPQTRPFAAILHGAHRNTPAFARCQTRLKDPAEARSIVGKQVLLTPPSFDGKVAVKGQEQQR
jgi:hypothetical protein